MEQIKYAVLETSGAISIIPMEPDLEEILDARIREIDAKLDAVLARMQGRSQPGADG